ncbi:hypothetical protein [Microbacterium sp. HJ5]
MSGEPQGTTGPVRPLTALAFATAGYVALLIFGLGMTSLATNADVIATPGLGQAPGVTATVVSTAAFALALWVAVRRSPASYVGSAWATAAAFLGYVGGVWAAAIATGTDLAVASAVAGRIATSWFGFVIAAAAFVASWAGIALVRTHARRPRWPWEDEFDE